MTFQESFFSGFSMTAGTLFHDDLRKKFDLSSKFRYYNPVFSKLSVAPHCVPGRSAGVTLVFLNN